MNDVFGHMYPLLVDQDKNTLIHFCVFVWGVKKILTTLYSGGCSFSLGIHNKNTLLNVKIVGMKGKEGRNLAA